MPQFADPQVLQLLWATPLFAAMGVVAALLRRRAARRFQPDARWHAGARPNGPPQRSLRPLKVGLLTLAFVALVVAAARPGWGPRSRQVERRGRDVVFVVDVSRSMLAQDLAPNRLERAKLAILDTIERLEGDRVALVPFAGTASVKSPLTTDYGFFRSAAARLAVTSVPRGGTLLGDALRTVRDEVLDARAIELKDILLITDGEDQGSFPVEVAQELGAQGVRIIAIGIGDPLQGQPIPAAGGFVEHDGQRVLSRLDDDGLRAVAGATPGGRYVNVATGNVDLGDLYTTLIASAEQAVYEDTIAELFEDRFQLFVAVALGSLALALALPDRLRRRSRGERRRGAGPAVAGTTALAVVAMATTVLAPVPGHAVGAAEASERRAHRAFAEGRYQDALVSFDRARELRPGTAALSHGAGLAAYHAGDLATAAQRLRETVQSATRPEVAAAGHFALGNTAARIAEQQLQTNPGSALTSLRQAIDSYERTLDLQSDHPTAGHNLEVARQLLEQLEQQKQQQPSDEGQAQQQEEGNREPDPGAGGGEDNGGAAADAGGEPPPAAGQEQDQDQPPLDPDATAAAIIAEEEANAAERERRQQQQLLLSPVERDW